MAFPSRGRERREVERKQYRADAVTALLFV
jgi:hypothetical protein